MLCPFFFFSASCEKTEYSPESIEDRYPSDPYEPKAYEQTLEKKEPHLSNEQTREKKSKGRQDPNKTMEDAGSNITTGKPIKPMPSEYLLK